MGGVFAGALLLVLLAPAPAARLDKLDESKLGQLIRDRHGRALFINIWATWCAPCKEEFPDIVRLSEEMKNEKVDFVGVSSDDADDEMSKVLPFITRQHAGFKFYLAKIEGEDHFINAFDTSWGGGIPATFVYDARGRKRAFLLGKQSYERLNQAVRSALPRH